MKNILYRLSWSGGDHWRFEMGLSTPDGLSHLFEDGTLFRAGGPSSYATPTPEEAVSAAMERMRLQIDDDERRLRSAEAAVATSRKLMAAVEKERENLVAEGKQLADCRSLVEEFFKGDVDKTRKWFKTMNPLLGQVTPDDMVALHRTEKLLKFIKDQLAENRPESRG